ncbi:pyridoxamine 5'-phosphate oxidase family protein [Actinomadura gamaensis]|uniref:Pyridoxamine 5'-phosphate oxidase family protein n=1 Tax=Actinomadura gamaensis TaxID=1763541 RepID=A0ABV9TU48_9ACTN
MTTVPRLTRRLTRQESLALLGSASMGRVVFTHHALPAIRPVNHVLDEDTIIIRSHLGAAIVGHTDQAQGAVVAYEADDIDPVSHLGWSVVVTGTARLVRDPGVLERYKDVLRPWVDGEMDHVVSITPDLVTGVRLVAGEPGP